jgi:hypothetical protein
MSNAIFFREPIEFSGKKSAGKPGHPTMATTTTTFTQSPVLPLEPNPYVLVEFKQKKKPSSIASRERHHYTTK